ncbi:MAG: 2-octaprenyl-3-methyl-6-methoxy-1,4-benzoquinol hydroxylase [Gammaproteobacteria bacterium RIFCSPHIGHO2_12_38_15]|nr:MAG: 2-octaprenyl-3-methyl-6-methoxy-1,4-benzoquinol hydroxylase [Gammaproteobacteria bacterium RIFCSPHIGHO2_12_38_15]
MSERHYNFFDKCILFFEQAQRTVKQDVLACRISPAKERKELVLTAQERRLSANLLRVDHAGEVCAQALYLGHALAAKNKKIKNHFISAAQEETDHLVWCALRLKELNDHRSYLNPVWYTGSFAMGFLSGLGGEKWNLGFVAETEMQVEAHLKAHLRLLPEKDEKTKAILLQMKEDEMAHAQRAIEAGGEDLPVFIKKTMKVFSKIMTTLAFYV